MAFINQNRRQEPQASRYEALHGIPQALGSGASSPSSGFANFDRAILSPAALSEDGSLKMQSRLYASDSSIVASEFNERLLIFIGGFTYSHSVYHAVPASPFGPIVSTSLETYTKSGMATVGTLGTSFGMHQYWESWEYGVHAIDALTQTLARSGGCNVQIGLFELPTRVTTPLASPPKAGALVPAGKTTPAAMPATAATMVGTSPTVAEWTTLFESLHAAPGFGNTNLTFPNKSMFVTGREGFTVTQAIHGIIFGAQQSPVLGDFIGIPTSTGATTPPGPTPVASLGYLVLTYGDRGAVTFPNSQGEFLGSVGDRARWWSKDVTGDSYLDLVPGLDFSKDGRQEPHHILYEIADSIMLSAFDQVDKRAFFDRTATFARDTRMPIQGFPPIDVSVTAGATPGFIEVGWTNHIAAPDDNTEGRWTIYLSADSVLIADVKGLRERNELFTDVNINNGLSVMGIGPRDKINTPSFVQVISGLVSGVTYFVTMTNVHFNCYLLRSTRGVHNSGSSSAQQGQVEIAESEIFLPVKSVVVP